MHTIRVRVAEKSQEANSVVRMELAPLGAQRLPSFVAGAHINVMIRPGLQRAYSLCNASLDQERYVIAVQLARLSRGGSATLVSRMQVGDVIEISAPINNIRLLPARRSIFLLEGIGIAAALGMMENLSRMRADFEVHHFVQSIQHAPLLAQLMDMQFDTSRNLHIHQDEFDSSLDFDTALSQVASDVHVFICGSAAFTSIMHRLAVRAGWSHANLHTESFSPEFDDGAKARPFRIKIRSTNKTYWISADQTVSDVLREQGVDLPASCGEGMCGTCVTRVLQGTVEHRDFYLTSRERAMNDRFMPCCSRALTDMLVLDI